MEPVERVEQALAELGLPAVVTTFDASTATAQDAADAVGCELGQIVKTLFFMADGRPMLVLAAGDRQVDTARLAQLVGVGRKKLKMGTPEQVEEFTGFETGGVSPLGLPANYDVVIDESLRRFERVWVAAGSRSSVFGIGLEALAGAVHGQWGEVVRESAEPAQSP